MKKKKYFIIAGIIVLLVIVAVILIFAIPPNAKKVPQALSEGFARTAGLSFLVWLRPGEKVEYFWLIGESSGESRHIEGRVLGSQVDLYYVDGQIYRCDMIAEEWYCYSAENLAEAAELMLNWNLPLLLPMNP